jgi:hypothetical protein
LTGQHGIVRMRDLSHFPRVTRGVYLLPGGS